MSSIVIDYRYQSIAIGDWYRLISSVSTDFRYRFLSIDYAWYIEQWLLLATLAADLFLACVVWWFWLGAQKGGQGQRNREEIGAAWPLVRACFALVFGASPLSRGPDKTAMLRRLTYFTQIPVRFSTFVNGTLYLAFVWINNTADHGNVGSSTCFLFSALLRISRPRRTTWQFVLQTFYGFEV